MMFYGNGMGAWGYVAMTVSSLVFWGLLAAGVVALFRYAGRPHNVPPPAPEQLLAERYARGEIDDEEYRRRLATLRAATA